MDLGTRKAVIFGCSGETVTPEEVQFFQTHQPWGFILFARNCASPQQIQTLCSDLRACVNDPDAPILIDQEGGRVARLKPPQWPARPPMEHFTKLGASESEEAAFLGARLLAEDVREVGVNVNCVPVLDVPLPDAHDIIGDRALGTMPEQVARLGREVIDGSLDGQVLPIIKHIPGHGGAMADSHLDLPIVDASREELENIDFAPFRALNDAPMAMTAHVVYSAIDADNPATLSPTVINKVIRGHIGFDGLLMTDDLWMKALSGSFKDRCEQALTAGCDMLLHCNGEMDEMQPIAATAPILSGKALERAERVMAALKPVSAFDREAAEERFNKLLKPVMA